MTHRHTDAEWKSVQEWINILARELNVFVAATSESKESYFLCYIQNLDANNEETYVQCSLYIFFIECERVLLFLCEYTLVLLQ